MRREHSQTLRLLLLLLLAYLLLVVVVVVAGRVKESRASKFHDIVMPTSHKSDSIKLMRQIVCCCTAAPRNNAGRQ